MCIRDRDDRVVRADRIAGDDVDVGEGEALGDGFTARDEQLLLVGCGGRGLGVHCHAGLPYTVLCCAFSPGIPAMISTPPLSRSCLSSSSYWPRKRKPCERAVAFLLLILSISHVL